MELPVISLGATDRSIRPVWERTGGVGVYHFQSAAPPIPALTQHLSLEITRFITPQEMDRAFGALARDAIRDYQEGNTRSLREFASDEGIPVGE